MQKRESWKRVAALIMVFAMGISLCACGREEDEGPAPTGPTILEEAVSQGSFVVTFRKGSKLGDQVWAALQVLKAEGTVGELATKWFGSDITSIPGDSEAVEAIELPEQRTLIMGVDQALPPMGYQDGDGNVVGFDVDLARAVCSMYGWTLELVVIDPRDKVLELESGNIDCIWSGLSYTESLEDTMECTEPYIVSDQVLVVMQGTKIAEDGKLANRILGLREGSLAVVSLNADPDLKDSLSEAVPFNTYLECFTALEDGSIDAVLVDRVVAEFYLGGGDTAALGFAESE